jgi:hypothetical protein
MKITMNYLKRLIKEEYRKTILENANSGLKLSNFELVRSKIFFDIEYPPAEVGSRRISANITKGSSDSDTLESITDAVNHYVSMYDDNKEYSPEEIKGIIGELESLDLELGYLK